MDVVGGNETTATKEEKKKEVPVPAYHADLRFASQWKRHLHEAVYFCFFAPRVCRCVTRCERRPASLFWPLLSHPIDGIRLIFYRLAQERRREKIMGAVWFHDRHTSCRSEIIPCTYQIK